MNRREFMDALEKQLLDMPVEDRIDILQYYEDYFEDAGYEKEQDIINELKSPENVAYIIKNDLGVHSENETNGNMYRSEYKDYRKNYYDNSKEEQFYSSQSDYTQSDYTQSDYTQSNSGSVYEKSKKRLRDIDKRIWIILLILILPFSFSTIVGIFSTVLGVLLAIFGILIGAYAGGAGCIIGAAALLATGMFSNASLVFGIGLILIAVGLLFTILCRLVCSVVIPTVFRGIKKIFNYLFRDGEAAL